jgi:NADH-quinone oxidoreductase subunit K
MTPLHHYLLLSAALFAVGLGGALARRNAIMVLIGIELMLNAANLNFIAFWRYGDSPGDLDGMMSALIIAIYRHFKTANVDEINSLKG